MARKRKKRKEGGSYTHPLVVLPVRPPPPIALPKTTLRLALALHTKLNRFDEISVAEEHRGMGGGNSGGLPPAGAAARKYPLLVEATMCVGGPSAGREGGRGRGSAAHTTA